MKTVNLNTPMPQVLNPGYHDENMVMFDNVHQIHLVQEIHEKYLSELSIMMVVEDGTCSAVINNKEVQLGKHDLIMCTPGNIIERGNVSMNFQCRIFLFSPKFMANVIKGTHMSLASYLTKRDIDILSLNDVECKIMLEYYSLLSSFNPLEDSEVKKLTIRSIMQAFAYSVTGFFFQRGVIGKTEKWTSAEKIFRSFAQLLKMHPEGRSVKFYADKLNISPKYFNSICKQVSGKTASRLINEELVTRAKAMLGDPDMSIKQIASTLGFTNQSHFGSYMRKETGVSPLVIRQEFFKKS